MAKENNSSSERSGDNSKSIASVVHVPDAPKIEGLTFRRFRGENDYPVLLQLSQAAFKADGEEVSETVDDIARQYSHLVRCDLSMDTLFAEIDCQAVGYCRCWWSKVEAADDDNEMYTYGFFVLMEPTKRDTCIGQVMSAFMQARLREIAADHPDTAKKFFQTFATKRQEWNTQLYVEDGFQGVRYGFKMTRLCNEPIHLSPLPEGIEIRPATRDHFRQIWEAKNEAFRDHWNYVEQTEEDYTAWLESPECRNPEMWVVAWDGDAVVGQVLNYVNAGENEEFKRRRGYTEDIGTRRRWRRRGVAKALLTRSIKMFQEMGMEETALGVDTKNPNGAMALYEDLGYKEIHRFTLYRKAFA